MGSEPTVGLAFKERGPVTELLQQSRWLPVGDASLISAHRLHMGLGEQLQRTTEQVIPPLHVLFLRDENPDFQNTKAKNRVVSRVERISVYSGTRLPAFEHPLDG